MTSFNTTITSSQYGKRQQSKKLHYRKNLRSETEGVKEKNLSWVWGVDRKIRPSRSHSGITKQASDPRDEFFYLPLTQMIDSYILDQNFTLISLKELQKITQDCKLNGPRHTKTFHLAYVDREGPDQPVHPRILIRTFTIRLKNHWTLQKVWMESKGLGDTLRKSRLIRIWNLYSCSKAFSRLARLKWKYKAEKKTESHILAAFEPYQWENVVLDYKTETKDASHWFTSEYRSWNGLQHRHSRTSIARTPMARLPWLIL